MGGEEREGEKGEGSGEVEWEEGQRDRQTDRERICQY